MVVTLYNHMNCLPADLGDHVFVFTGRAFDPDDDPEGVITVASCSYRVGEQLVSFRRNMETTSQRFENTLKWAVKCAATFGIENIHAVFELNRPISARYLEKICPDGVVDLRPRLPVPCEARAPAASMRSRGQTGVMLPRRRLVFRNRNRTIKSARPFLRS